MCFQLVCSNLLLLWIELVHYIIHELLKLCTPKNSLEQALVRMTVTTST